MVDSLKHRRFGLSVPNEPGQGSSNTDNSTVSPGCGVRRIAFRGPRRWAQFGGNRSGDFRVLGSPSLPVHSDGLPQSSTNPRLRTLEVPSYSVLPAPEELLA